MINLDRYKIVLTYNKPKEIIVYEETIINEQYTQERLYIKPRETPTSTKINYGKKEYTYVKAEYPLSKLPQYVVSIKNKESDIIKKVLDPFIYLKSRYVEREPETGEIIDYVKKFNLEYLLEKNNFVSKKRLFSAVEKKTYAIKNKIIPISISASKFNVFLINLKPKFMYESFTQMFQHKAGLALQSYFSKTVIMRYFEKRYLLRTYRVGKGTFWKFIRLLVKIIGRLNSLTLIFLKKNVLLRVLKKLIIWSYVLKMVIKKLYKMLKMSLYRRKLSIGRHFRKFFFYLAYQKVMNIKKLSKFFKLLKILKKKHKNSYSSLKVTRNVFVSFFSYFKMIFIIIFFKFVNRLQLIKQVKSLINIKDFTVVKVNRVKVAPHLPHWFFDNVVVIKRVLFLIRNITRLRHRKLRPYSVLKKNLRLKKKVLLFCKLKKDTLVNVLKL